LLSIIITLPFGKISEWRDQQIQLLTDYTWQVFDDLWRNQREDCGPQTSKSGSGNYSYYLVHGLGSAMEILVFQPDAFHIVHTCLQDFYGTAAEREMFRDLFGKDNPLLQKIFLEYASLSVGATHADNLQPPPRLSISHKRNLRRDFLNAHTLQYFVSHNPKLHRALLPHRVELYIRIKNSAQIFERLSRGSGRDIDEVFYIEGRCIGTSTECPIRCTRDAESLSSGKFSFVI
jgi:hypothetical protein